MLPFWCHIVDPITDSTPITTKLNVGFDIHLPYTTKDGNNTSLLVIVGPNVAVNLILGLQFIKVTDMIADFVDYVCLLHGIVKRLHVCTRTMEYDKVVYLV